MRDLVIGVTVVLADGHGRELGRQGRQERRRLRPRQALLGLAGPARPGRARSRCASTRARPPRRPSSSSCDDPRATWLELQRSQLEPSAVDFLPPRRLALLFEGAADAVEAQVGRVPRGARRRGRSGSRARERQAAAAGRAAFAWQDCLLARPGRRDRLPRRRRPSDRGRRSPSASGRSFDPEGILA